VKDTQEGGLYVSLLDEDVRHVEKVMTMLEMIVLMPLLGECDRWTQVIGWVLRICAWEA
jgi:hypothetical protein